MRKQLAQFYVTKLLCLITLNHTTIFVIFVHIHVSRPFLLFHFLCHIWELTPLFGCGLQCCSVRFSILKQKCNQMITKRVMTSYSTSRINISINICNIDLHFEKKLRKLSNISSVQRKKSVLR